MKYLLVGSRALNHFIELGRVPKDVDYICDFEFFQRKLKDIKTGENVNSYYPLSSNKWVVKTDETIYEFEIAYGKGTSSDLLLEIYEGIAPSQVLYMLKMSHRFKKNSPHFLKTMEDIKIIREKQGYSHIFPELIDIYNLRMEETYNYKHPNLKTTKGEFFNDDGVNYVYDHDSIHEVVKVREKPAYSYIKEDTSEVYCSKDLFYRSGYENRLNTVLEESMVLAIERCLVPFPDTLDPVQAFKLALMKVCTSISSGWWREFAWEHYHLVLGKFEKHRENGFKYEAVWGKAVDNQEVKLYKQENI